MDNSIQFTNTFDTDFKLEVVVSSLVEQGWDPELIRILREGISRRPVSKDVEKVYQEYNQEDFKDYLHIHINREGIYDMLPEGLFHQPLRHRRNPDKEDLIDEIKIHRQEEFFARRFFQVFEQTVDKTLVEIYQAETRYDWNIHNRDFVDLFIQYWPVIRQLEQKQAVSFMYIMPLLSSIRLNLDEVSESLSFILDVPIKITKIKLPAKKADSRFEAHLGEVYLGVDLVLGNAFDDGLYDLKITIGAISANRMRSFLKTAPEYTVLMKLLEIFLPDETFAELNFKIDPQDSTFILSDGTHETYLGINSFL